MNNEPIVTTGRDNGAPFVGPSDLDQAKKYPQTGWEYVVVVLLAAVIMWSVWSGWGLLLLLLVGAEIALLFFLKGPVTFWLLVSLVPITLFCFIVFGYDVMR